MLRQRLATHQYRMSRTRVLGLDNAVRTGQQIRHLAHRKVHHEPNRLFYPTTTNTRPAPAPWSASRTYRAIGRPQTRTLGKSDFICVPLPAASTIARGSDIAKIEQSRQGKGKQAYPEMVSVSQHSAEKSRSPLVTHPTQLVAPHSLVSKLTVNS